jgi:PadR family transcriptional regulator PadR
MAKLGVVRGTLDILILKALTWQPMHGLEVIGWLEKESGGRLELEDSALYQSLHRMEERQLVTAAWGVSDKNRRARYYIVTDAGRGQLVAETERWNSYAGMVSGILALAPSLSE